MESEHILCVQQSYATHSFSFCNRVTLASFTLSSFSLSIGSQLNFFFLISVSHRFLYLQLWRNWAAEQNDKAHTGRLKKNLGLIGEKTEIPPYDFTLPTELRRKRLKSPPISYVANN